MPTAKDALRERLLARVLPGSDDEPDSRELTLGAGRTTPPACEQDDIADQADTASMDIGAYCDPHCGPPDGEDWWLSLLPSPLIDEYYEASLEREGPEVLSAGFWDRSSGRGTKFASGGAADRLAPGAVLSGLAGDAWRDGLGRLTDDELVGVLRAARRLTSWSAALELAAVSDLMRRRWDQEARGASGAAEHAADEIAAALTLTGRSADLLADLAQAMDRLPATLAALASGDIDLPRARVIAEETSGLDDRHAAAVEQDIISHAASQTTGQLRAAARRAVIAADPGAARARKERAQREARVERWDEPAGTSALAGRDLPPAHVLTADHHLTTLARTLQDNGVHGTIDALRAKVFLALLSGQTPASLLQPASPAAAAAGNREDDPSATTASTGVLPASSGRPAVDAPTGPEQTQGRGRQTRPDLAGAGLGITGPQPTGRESTGLAGRGLAGQVNLTLPLATWIGLCDVPGEVAGHGPLDADDSRTLADLLSQHPRTHWCITLTDTSGRPAAHGCALTGSPSHPGMASPPRPILGGPALDEPSPPGSVQGRPSPSGPASDRASLPAPACPARTWTAHVTLETLETGDCTHRRESRAYRPPPRLAHFVRIRGRTCSFPGCRRSAGRCDLDHTIPYDQGGRTCECDLAPLCRRHHRAKQAHGWHLEQPEPGILVWTLPSGRSYTTRPASYPSEQSIAPPYAWPAMDGQSWCPV